MVKSTDGTQAGDGSTPRRQRRRPARERIRQIADVLLYREGTGTSVDRIIAEADVSKQTLYGNFGNKEGLIADYLKRRNEATLHALTTALDAARSAPPLDQVLAMFEVIEARSTDEDFRGCAFVLAAAESPLGPAREAGRTHKTAVRDLFAGILTPHTPDAEPLAEQLMLIYDGAMVTALLRPDTGPFTHARTLATRLLGDL